MIFLLDCEDATSRLDRISCSCCQKALNRRQQNYQGVVQMQYFLVSFMHLAPAHFQAEMATFRV
jgi:hypothetical protein